MNNFSIAVFGCWNEGCKNNSGQKSVSNIIKSNESKYEFMVILGDNYYAKKKTLIELKKSKLKIKLTNIQELKEGFNCLQNINLEKKLIMGNHDVEDSMDKSCSILKTQLKLPWYDVKFPFGYDMYYLYGDKKNTYNETILFIYLDTSLYSIDLNDNNSCYNLVLHKNIADLKNEQNIFLENTLKITKNKLLNISNVIFFGHEPLFTFKEKKGINEPSINLELLRILFDNKPDNINFYWICADYHIYQNSVITNKSNPNQKISQWIFGTGGGELDSPVNTNFMEIQNYNLNIEQNIVFNSNHDNISDMFTENLGVNRFGYGEITFGLCTITHKFILSDYVDNENYNKKIKIVGGANNNYKEKYTKYKTKYTELKKFVF
jgi:hypothetical protein